MRLQIEFISPFHLQQLNDTVDENERVSFTFQTFFVRNTYPLDHTFLKSTLFVLLLNSLKGLSRMGYYMVSLKIFK